MMESWGAEATCALLAAQMNLSEASRGLLGFSLARDAVWGATPTLLPVAVAFPAVQLSLQFVTKLSLVVT